MFVCICKGITDSQIRDAVEQGAESIADVREQLGTSTQCGRCVSAVKEVVQMSLDEKAASLYYQVA